MKKELSKEQMEMIRNLAAMPDEEIDLSDSPEVQDWSGSVVGKFYRPMKERVTIRLDADVLDWLKGHGRGYQTRINRALREYVHGRAGRAPRSGAKRHPGRQAGRV